MRSSAELPYGLLPRYDDPPKAVYQYELERNYQQQIYDAKKMTCRKGWLFVCSAFEAGDVECSGELLLIAEDLLKAERLVRDRGWSVLKDLGWTCSFHRKQYKSPKGNVGPRKKVRRYRHAMTTNQMKVEREAQVG